MSILEKMVNVEVALVCSAFSFENLEPEKLICHSPFQLPLLGS